ncbi:MAG: LD-carboxypeptidase [Rickettsiales bacterium]|nr:MAG: LD-carboxypeptidase [Rickettsiales bacterium]
MIDFNLHDDYVSIIAPSSALRDNEGLMDKDLSFEKLKITLSLFEQQGFKCKYDENIFDNCSLEFFANNKQERLRQLKEALLDPQVKIISAFRGGYGAAEIVFDCMDIKPSEPKILIGFSDITVLHFLFNQHYKFPSIHTLIHERLQNMLPEFISVMQGNNVQLELKNINQSLSLDSEIKGITTGGNLTLICNMIGTKLHPVTKNKILIIEEIGEVSYRVHRSLLHLFNVGLFDEVSAVIFADFTVSDKKIDETIQDFTLNYLHHIPVYRTKNIGHGPVNYPFAMGAKALIKDNSLIIESPFKLV